MGTIRLKNGLNKWVNHPIKWLSYAVGDRHICVVHGLNGAVYHCAMSVREILNKYPGIGLRLINQGKLINIHDVMDVLPFDVLVMVMLSDGSKHEPSALNLRIYRRFKLKKWIDLLKF